MQEIEFDPKIFKSSKKYKAVRKDLLKQLKYRGADTPAFCDLVEDYMSLWLTKEMLRVDIENTLLAYNDIVELKKDGFICNYSFIDNNKINNIKEFNKEVMQTILNAYSLNNIELDINDSRRIHNARGYKVFLELNEEFCDNVEDAIDYSIHNSNFIIPESFKNCTHLGISVSENFNAFNISDEFNIKEFDKADISDENNILVIGGCKEPISTIKAYEECLSKSMDYSIADEEEYIINIPKQEPKFEKFKGIVEEKPKKITKADLRKELDDLF